MGRMGFLAIFALIGFFAAVAVKVVPVYVEHFHAHRALEQLASELKAGEKAGDEIIGLLQQRLTMDQVDDIAREDILVEPLQDGRYEIKIVYDVVVPIVGNLSVLVIFDDSAETGRL